MTPLPPVKDDKPCPRCQGRKVVYVPRPGGIGGGFAAVRCECVIAAERDKLLAASGVPPVMRRATLDRLAAESVPGVVASINRPGRRAHLLVAPVLSMRAAVTVAYAVRSYLESGRRAARVTLSGAIDAVFDRDQKRAHARTIATPGLLVFVLDIRNGHKMVPQVCEELLAARAVVDDLTLVVAHEDPRPLTGLYGPQVCRHFGKMPLDVVPVTSRNRAGVNR